MLDFVNRLEKFLVDRNQAATIDQLTPDASTREYFRVRWNGTPAIACVYPDSFVSSEQSYLDVTRLFLSCGLPVAAILDHDEQLGVILLEDLGDRILREWMETAAPVDRERAIDDAIRLIPRIQAATETAYQTGSIASKLKFDTEKLAWELDFFKTHYFATFLKKPLPAEIDREIESEFLDLARELEMKASVLCHRDFHAANLMLADNNELRIIDHQDARIGSAAYDLVSLLLDRVTDLPTPEWLAEKREIFLAERKRIGLPSINETEFADEFRLQTIQRCLKAVGTFSFQSVNRGKNYFVPFIKPMFRIVFRALDNLERFPCLKKVVGEQTSE